MITATSNEEYYQQLSLPIIPTIRNKEEINEYINEIESKEKQDKLKKYIQDLEKSKKKLETKLSTQLQLYEKTQREAQLYKLRYENYIQQNKQKRPSNASYLSGKSFSSSARSSSSCSSSIRTSNLSLMDELIDPALFYDQHLNDSDDDNGEFDLYSIMSNPESFTLPNSPTMTPIMSPLSIKPPSEESDKQTAKQEKVLKDTTPLQFACGEGFWNTIALGKLNKSEVETLVSNYLRRGGNPNVAKISDTVKNVKEGYGLIHAIIAVKNTAALHKILDAGVNINACPLTSKREDQIPPIILAAKLGYMNGMKLLLERGGISLLIDSRGPYGETALHAAVQSESDEMVGFILRVSQNELLEKVDNNGATPLHYACVTGKIRLITLFIRDCQGKSDPRDNKGETPLHYAVRNRKLKVIAKLVRDLGTDPNPYILKQVPTPLDLAKSGGFKNIVELLKSVGGKTTKEIIRSGVIHSCNSSVISGESTGSGDSTTLPSGAALGVRQFLHTKTSQILRGTFDL